MAHINIGYNRHADWMVTNQTWTWGGFMTATLGNVIMRLDIPGTLDSLTATIVGWNFSLVPPTSFGDGFIDFIGFAWWDERDRTYFTDEWFFRPPNPDPPPDRLPEEPGKVFNEIKDITVHQQTGFYDLDTWFWCWQGNEGAGRVAYAPSPVGMSHTWPLTADDWDDDGCLKDRIVFVVYKRHYDVFDFPAPHHSVSMEAHWYICDYYWLSMHHGTDGSGGPGDDGPGGIWNWKYHPMAIRKGNEWYSCNRLNSEVGHGDGHLAIRKGGQWNAVWNDDFYIETSEAYDDSPPEGEGPWVYLPRVGIGNDAIRTKADVHEWEE